MSCGIYIIINKINKKNYVGSSLNIEKRKATHLFYLNKNNHVNSHLQSAFNKYGRKAFKFKILKLVNENDFIRVEEYFINKFSSLNNGYNLISADRHEISKKTKKKIKENAKINPNYGMKGKKHTKETIIKITEAKKGSHYKKRKKCSEETKIKISNAQKGNHYRKGIKCSEESKKRMSEIQKINMTNEKKEKISKGLKKYWSKKLWVEL